MACKRARPCPGLAAIMSEQSIKFTQVCKLSADNPNYNAMFIHGLAVKMKDGTERLDSHILYFCPCCGVKFSTIVDNYVPTLIEEQAPPPKSKLILI